MKPLLTIVGLTASFVMTGAMANGQSIATPALTQPAPAKEYSQVQLPLEQLPQEHDYQKQLRAYMASLTEKDFALDHKEFTVVPAQNPDDMYRMWLLSVSPPTIGAVTLPPASFTLTAIEAKKSLVMPAAPPACQSLAWLANWNYAGNPYHGSRALKLRAFVLAAIDVAMLDYLYEHQPPDIDPDDRADYLGGNLIWIGYTYSIVKDVLPPEALAAFEAGIKKHVLRINGWGPKGLMTDMDLFAPVGLWYIQGAMHDPQITKLAQDYSRQLYTQPHYFNAAGYFVDNNCFDTSYNGISLYFSSWASLATDWAFVHEAVAKALRLRAHLCFPDPDGKNFSGPSEMSSRTSTDSAHDQWDFADRDYADALLSDDALYLAPLPKEEAVIHATESVVKQLNEQLAKAPKPGGQPWREVHWNHTLNFAYEYYTPGYYQRRLKLEEEHSPLLKPLYERTENFIHVFDTAFVIGKFDHFAMALHTGPVGRSVGYNGCCYGYGGGELATFWTPVTGVVIAGRRRGVQGGRGWDTYDEWRDWPIHAVSGLTTKSELVTSARIQVPEVSRDIAEDHGVVKASGNMPKYDDKRSATGPSGMQYERTFTFTDQGLQVQTQVTSDGQEQFTELYETIPVLLSEDGHPTPTTIEVMSQNASPDARAGAPAVPPAQEHAAWALALDGKYPNVKAVRLTRFKGAVTITFARPQTLTVTPSSKPWKDGYQSQARCRNLRIDLLDGLPQPATLKAVMVDYTIAAGSPPETPEAAPAK